MVEITKVLQTSVYLRAMMRWRIPKSEPESEWGYPHPSRGKKRGSNDDNAGLIDPSFQDAIAMIVASEELPEQLKVHWTTSMRQFAKATDRPLEVIPGPLQRGEE